MGPSRGAGRALAALGVAAAWALLALQTQAADGTPGGGGAQTAGLAGGPSAAALVVRGMAHYEGREMREGTGELERAATMRPDWAPARMALAVALLRSGSFRQALAEFERLVGADVARALASGDLRVGDAAVPPDPEALLGLAVVHQETGRLRAAERLYRGAADVWGPSSSESARAFQLLGAMLEERGVPWGDAAAERAKALALDPGVASRDLLPPFPDPVAEAELAPYTWPVEAAEPDSMNPPPDALPLLAQWPVADAGDTPAFQGTITVEALVGEDGRVIEAGVTAPQGLSTDVRDAAAGAVGAALFDPAVVGGVPARTRITLAVPGWAVPVSGPGDAASETPDTPGAPDAPAAPDSPAAPAD